MKGSDPAYESHVNLERLEIWTKILKLRWKPLKVIIKGASIFDYIKLLSLQDKNSFCFNWTLIGMAYSVLCNDLRFDFPLGMRGKNVDNLESKNKSPLMKKKSISAYFS